MLTLLTICATGTFFYLSKRSRSNAQTSLKNTQKASKPRRLSALSSLLSRSRTAQLDALSSHDQDPETLATARRLDRDLLIAATSLVPATLGLAYPLIGLLTIPGLLAICIIFSRYAYQHYRAGHGIGAYALAVLFYGGALVTGSFFAGAVSMLLSTFAMKLLHETSDHTKSNLKHIFSSHEKFAWCVLDGVETQVPLNELKPNDIISLHAGATIPVDGTIVSGWASIDEHILNGESQALEKSDGDQVYASTLVVSGKILVRVEKAGTETVAARIGDILYQTADFKNSVNSWGLATADTSARISMILGLIALPTIGLRGAVAMFNSSFGLYMIVLGPLAMLVFLNLASKKGILIKDGRAFQLMRHVDTVVFDKTGTLTLEQPHVAQIHTFAEVDANTVLLYAAYAERKQTHPFATAILKQAQDNQITVPHIDLSDIEAAHYTVGFGLSVILTDDSAQRHVIKVGSLRYMQLEGLAISPHIEALQQQSSADGHSLVFVAHDAVLIGAIELHATLRPQAKQVIAQLKQQGKAVYIMSGDHAQPTRLLAQQLGVTDYFAETLPETKSALIKQLQDAGKTVCFVGDGINDTIALKQAHVSISLRGASSAATDCAQIILMHQELSQLIELIELTDQFKRNMHFSMAATIAPGIITTGGVFFMDYGIFHTILLNNLGILLGAGNTLLPLAKHHDPIMEITDEPADDTHRHVVNLA